MTTPDGDTAPPLPPDTDQYIWRYVTKYQNDTILSVPTQIWISQP